MVFVASFVTTFALLCMIDYIVNVTENCDEED
jgi:hypothetical protein